MSEAALLRGAGAEGQPAAALFQELEVACKKPPLGVAQMEARAQLAQKLESEAAAELKATAQTAEADVATAELVKDAAAQKTAQSTFRSLGDVSTSPWLNDPRVGVRTHLESFREGGSFLMPKSVL